MVVPRPSTRAWKIVHQYSHSLLPDSSSFSRCWPSSSVQRGDRALVSWHARRGVQVCTRQGIVLFRLCPREVSYSCFSFCEALTREARKDLAQPVKVDAFARDRIKAFSQGSNASQHRISVPKCLFLLARKAVEAVDSLAPRLSGVLNESSRTVRFLSFSMTIF